MKPYRGLTKDGKMVYGYYIVLGSHHLIADETTDWDSAGEAGVIEIEGLIEVIPESISQQVGKQDDNGKEIYEGDEVQGSGVWGSTSGSKVVFSCDGAEVEIGDRWVRLLQFRIIEIIPPDVKEKPK